MARRNRNRSVRRRKQRGGDGGILGAFGRFFGRKSSSVTADTINNQPPPQPTQKPAEPQPKKYKIITPVAVATLQLYNKNDNIAIGQIVTLQEGSENELPPNFAPSFAKYNVYISDSGVEIKIPNILIKNGVEEHKLTTGGRRSTRKQRR